MIIAVKREVMTTTMLNAELARVLWAVYEVWRASDADAKSRLICFEWIIGKYEERFGTSFHQSKLSVLAKMGYLKADMATRGGNRRYYTLLDPEAVRRAFESVYSTSVG